MLVTGLERCSRAPSGAASARASAWLPPAMPHDGVSLNAATPASSSAPTRSAVTAADTSTRARIASRTAAG